MWNKISQVAGLASAESEDEKEEEKKSAVEDKEHLEQQELLIQHLKDLVRENEKRFQDKTKEFDELSSKFQKFKLQSKAKISHLSSQIKDQEKTSKKEDCEFDDTSSSDSSDQSRRGKVLLFKKQLEQVKQQLDKKEKECKNLTEGYERRINDLELQLNEKNILISTLADAESKEKTPESPVDKSPKKESSVQEMYAQIVYKDSKIMELNNQILEHEKQIMDLQEHIKEKDEVLQQRSRAVQLMAEDMNRKGKSVVNELDETREQMKIMQENFSSNESDWKVQIDKYKLRISELENDVSEMDKKVKSCEVFIKSLEAAKYELTVKNAELQKKIVSVQESAAKQCELYNKEIGGEVETWKKSLESEKQKVAELQKTLDEMNSQSDNKVLKARVKERTKFKALERELNELKKANEEKPKETLELEQRVAELEEEKGSLQLKLMEIEEQVSQLEKLKDKNKLLHANVEEGLNKIQNFEKQILELQEGREKWEAKFETLNESYNELTDKFNVTAREKSDMLEKFTDLLSSKEKIEINYKDLKKDHSNIENMFKEVSDNYQQMKDQKVTFELKNIELEEIKENDEKRIKQLLSRIEQLEFSNESKPDIQLEKENLELKDKLRTLSDTCKGLENKNLNLLSQIELLQIKLTEEQNEKYSKINEIGEKMNHVDIKYQEVLKILDIKMLECTEKENNIQELEHKFDSLQHKLTEEQNGHAAEMKTLLDKFNDIELKYQEISHNFNDKTLECTENEKIAKELENNLTQVQSELSHVLTYFGVKNSNDCINYTVQKAEEYARLETNYNKEIAEKNNLLLTLTEKGNELENLGSKVEKLEFLLEKRDEGLKFLETNLEDLKETISGKETIIYNLSSELENEISALSSLNKAFEEKSQLLKIANESQSNLLEELKVLKGSHISNQEKTHANTTSLLGQISDLEMEIASLRDELSIKQTAIEDLNSNVASLLQTKEDVMAQVKENENFIQEKVSEVSFLKKELINKDKATEELNNTLRSLQDANQEILTKIEEKQNVILEKEDLISNFKSSMDSNKELFSFLQVENESLKNNLTDKVSEISSLNQKMEEFDHLLKARSDELSGITVKLHETLKSLQEMEEELITLKNKNELLEKEKLHSNLSLTEKDELYKQILTDKLQLEVDIQKLQNENKSFNSLLNEKVDELDVFNSTINKLSNLIKGNDPDVQEFLKQLFDDNNKLARFAEKWFSLLADNKNLGSEISNSKNQLLQIQSVVETQQKELNETNLFLKESQKQSDEKSTKVGMLENDLKLTCDLKSKLDAELSEMQEKIQNLNEENNTLEAKLSTLQEEHLSQSSSLNSNLLNYQKKLEDALARVENLQTENLKLTEQLSHLDTSLKSCELKEKQQEKKMQGLSEKCFDFENKAVELNDLNINLNKKIQSLEKEFTQTIIKQTEEKAALELLHQSFISDNKKIHESNIELQARIDRFENEKHLNECSTSELKALISDKDLQITNLNSQLDALAKKLSNLQTDFNQKQDEHEKYNESFKAKLMCYQNFKHHFYTVLEALRSSQQISTDISFLNSDDLNTESIDELAELSKDVVKDVVAHLSGFQYRNSQYSDMEDNIKQLQAENVNLSSEICTLKASLSNFTEILQENLEQNEKKIETIMSNFIAKENALMNIISKTVSVSTLLNSQKNHIASLESDLSLKVEQLQSVQGSLLKLDQIKILNKENEDISRDASLSLQKYKEKISEMDATLENVTSDFNSLQESFELKQKELENCLQSNQELKNALSSRNDQISKICEEQENSNNYVVILQSDLERAHTTISALQSEIRTLNNQISEHELEPHVLEASNNVSNGLQVEVETLRQRLTSYEEERTSLKQHIDNTNLQLQSLVNEKSILEASMEQMQHKLNDVIEANLGLTSSLEGSKSVIMHHQNVIEDLEGNQSECLANYERTRGELERLKSENAALDSNKSMNLNKITVLEENLKIFTNIVEKISILFDSGNFESEFDSPIMNVHLQDESLTYIISRLDASIHDYHNFRKIQVKETNNLQIANTEVQCKYNKLCKILEEYDTQQKQPNDSADKKFHTKDITIVPSDFSPTLDTNLLQQQASPVVESSEFLALENENKALKQEVNEYKIKFAKSLSKLKLFKDKFEKLSAEFKQLKDKNSELEAINSSSAQKEENIQIRVAALSKENEKLLRQIQLCNEQNKHELDKSNYIISQLRERIALSDEECFRIQQELQEYKQTWEQSNISYELQKEDNERLRVKLKEFQGQNDAYKTSVAEINSELTQLRNENVHWKQEVENSREHANMLLSDNDTYQILIEKLTLSKLSLEQKLSQSKEKFNLELKSLQTKHDEELKKYREGVSESTYQEPKHVKDLETECILLKTRCLEMQKYTETVEQERNTSLRNQNLLEKEKMYLQQQLMEKAGDLQTCRTKLNDCVKYENLVQSASSGTNLDKSVPEAVDIPNPEIEDQVGNRSFKLQLDSLSQELNVTKENFQALQQDCLLKENSYKDEISQLKVQLQGKSEMTVNLPKENKNLESELRQAMASLHNQGLRCEELSLEVSKLLEERNILKWKLQQAGQHPVMKEESDAYATASSELISVKVESPLFNADVAALHARLSESERTCQQLRQANDALDRALVNEKDQRRIIEEELGYAKDHLTEEAKASDEYHILLGDVNEPEYFAETNFAISRSVRTHAYKLRRWLRGRRNYLWRTVKSRNYSNLVYIFYIFCIHIWLLTCVFS